MTNNMNSIFLFRFSFRTPNFRHGTKRHLIECEHLQVWPVRSRNDTTHTHKISALVFQFFFYFHFIPPSNMIMSVRSELFAAYKRSDATDTDATKTHSKKCLLMSCNAIYLGAQSVYSFAISLDARHEFNLKCKTKIKVYFFSRPFRAWNIHQREI